MIASCPGPEAAKQPQTMMLPSPCFTVGMRYWCWWAVPFFLHTWCCVFLPNSSTFVSSVHNIFYQKFCGLSKCLFANIKCAAMVYLDSSGFLCGVLPWTPFLASVLHRVGVCTEILDCAIDFCKSLGDTLGFFRVRVRKYLSEYSALNSCNFWWTATPWKRSNSAKLSICRQFL